jgi:AraC-like DNA-binding protein
VPLGRDPRLRRATARLLAAPATDQTLADLATAAGASARTLTRLFHRETGLGFGDWRQRLRLIEALDALGDGESVGRVATRLGYASPSAFGAMIRRATGRPPGAFRRPPTVSGRPPSARR